jgi:hypothetical protein
MWAFKAGAEIQAARCEAEAPARPRTCRRPGAAKFCSRPARVACAHHERQSQPSAAVVEAGIDLQGGSWIKPQGRPIARGLHSSTEIQDSGGVGPT